MKKILLFVFVLSVAASVTGCETVKGVGRDITGASASVEEALSNQSHQK